MPMHAAGAAPGETRSTGGPDDLGGESIGYLVRYAHRALVRTLTHELQPHGLLASHWSVLRVLWQQEGLSQVQLAERMRVEKASLTGVLDGMERLTIIRRVRDAADRRRVNISLTERGRALKSALLPLADTIGRTATQGMSGDEAATLRNLLARVIVNLES